MMEHSNFDKRIITKFDIKELRQWASPTIILLLIQEILILFLLYMHNQSQTLKDKDKNNSNPSSTPFHLVKLLLAKKIAI